MAKRLYEMEPASAYVNWEDLPKEGRDIYLRKARVLVS